MSVWQDKTTLKWRYKFMYLDEMHEKKGFETMKKAQEEEANKKKNLRNPPPPTPPVIEYESFRALAKRYLEDCLRLMSVDTVRQKENYLTAFADTFDRAYPAKNVTREMVVGYFHDVHDAKGKSLADRHLKEIRCLFNWGFNGNGFPYMNPTVGIKKYNPPAKTRYNPPTEDILKAIMAATPEEMDLIETYYHTAARRSELWRITWDDVNFEAGIIVLWTRKRKSRQLEADPIPMDDRMRAILERRWKNRDKTEPWVFINPHTGKPYYRNSRTVKHLCEHLCKRAKVKRFTLHCLRHHVATILADMGKASIYEIKTMLRHKEVRTTEIYLKTNPFVESLRATLFKTAEAEAIKLEAKKSQNASQDGPQ